MAEGQKHTQELLPCPFCGGVAEFGDDGEGGQFIQCTKGTCQASSNIRYPLMEGVKPLLAEQWNRRVDAAAERDRYKAALEEIVEHTRHGDDGGPLPEDLMGLHGAVVAVVSIATEVLSRAQAESGGKG